MSLTRDLRNKHHDLWHRMVSHPFVVELGDGTLPINKARAYFLQDYVFVRDLVSMTALGVARAPDLESAGMLNGFLSGILSPENDFFKRAFTELGIAWEDALSATALPTTQAFGDFMVRVGLEGGYEDVLAVLYVTEGTYLDWGTRLIEAGKAPEQEVYREWIRLHGPDTLSRFVGWTQSRLDSADLSGGRTRIERVFLTALRYELLFWEAVYNGESWP